MRCVRAANRARAAKESRDFTVVGVCACARIYTQMFLFMVLRTHLIVTRDDDEFLAPGSFEWMLFMEIFRQGHLLRCVRECRRGCQSAARQAGVAGW